MQTITNKYALFQSSCYKRISTDTPADNDSYRNEDVENDVEGVLERIREYINRVITNKTEAVQTPVAP